jgi:putative ABC transport system permease protein
MDITGIIDSVGRDLRFALRGLSQRPAFTFAALLTLALGIGATTAIFSVVYSVLVKPLPYPNADELVRIRHSDATGYDLPSAPGMYFTYRDENRTFASIGLFQWGGITLTGREPERLNALRVTDGTLRTLGVQPMRGRWFTEEEHAPAADGPAPVILSHAFWQRRFGGDETIIGRELSSMLLEGANGSVDSRPSQVVGIMPPDFRFLDGTPQPDVILALRLGPRDAWNNFNYGTLARLKPGVTLAEAQTDAEHVLAIWPDAWPLPAGAGLTLEDIKSWRVMPAVRQLQDDLVGGVASTLWVLMGAIGAVLLVACANIANLMLVRADARRQEFAIRAALGAMPARIASTLLVESLVLGIAGGVLGLVLAHLGLEVLVAIGPSTLPRLREIAVYPPVLAFTAAVSLASTLVFGTITALKHARHVDTPMAARGSSASRGRNATRNVLVVVQVALALVLVVSAALMIRTFQALRDVDPGFTDPASIQTARIPVPRALFSDPERVARIQHEMLDRIAALPGVASAGFTQNLPMEAFASNDYAIEVEGQTPAPGDPLPARRNKYVSPGYFETMGTRIVAGRDITWSDIEAGGGVTVISEDFARELASEPAGALGKRIRLSPSGDPWREVIGVVESVHETGLYEDAPNIVYWPVRVENMLGQPVYGLSNVAFVIRSERAGTASLMQDVRQAVRSVNGNVPVVSERTMLDLYSDSLARTSFTLAMLAIAGGMALALGVVGIYGVIAYVVSQRTQEIGIRLALGAEPRQLKGMFLRHGLALGAVGATIGLGAAAALGRSISSLLFGVSPLDPVAYIAALGVILAAAALASYLPARRAATIDPIETLRTE